jgi:hypothetical protein
LLSVHSPFANQDFCQRATVRVLASCLARLASYAKIDTHGPSNSTDTLWRVNVELKCREPGESQGRLHSSEAPCLRFHLRFLSLFRYERLKKPALSQGTGSAVPKRCVNQEDSAPQGQQRATAKRFAKYALHKCSQPVAGWSVLPKWSERVIRHNQKVSSCLS